MGFAEADHGMRYNPALDGLRAISVLIVVAFHANVPLARGGMIGVDVFFVISGYLITAILRSELEKSGSIDLRNFYIRRFWRLMPALLLAMAGTYLFYKLVRPQTDINGDIIASLLYYADYRIALGHVTTTIKHTWSLAVEAQFYLLWPLFLLATRRLGDKMLFRLLLAMFVTATIWRCFDILAWHDWPRTYYSFDTRLSGLFLGAALAVSGWRLDPAKAGPVGILSILLLAYLCLTLRWKHVASLTTGVLLAEFAAVGLILAIGAQTSVVARALSAPWLVYIGTLSYSIYLWHYGLAVVVRHALDPALSFAVTFGVAAALSALSYRFVEAPCLAWSRRGKASGDGDRPPPRPMVSPP